MLQSTWDMKAPILQSARWFSKNAVRSELALVIFVSLILGWTHRTPKSQSDLTRRIASTPISQEPILYIGDSISYGKFGQTIDESLRGVSAHVLSEASCGSTPATWMTTPGQAGHSYAKTVCGFWRKGDTEERSKEHLTPKIEEELSTEHPRVTVIQLGTNIAASSNPAAQRATVRHMMQEIRASGSQCVWIGPPDANSTVVTREKLGVTNEMIRSEALSAGCTFIDTLSFTRFPPGPGDGIHPSPHLAEQWADDVINRAMPEIETALRAPEPSTLRLEMRENGVTAGQSGSAQ
jgi:hypothetical protein